MVERVTSFVESVKIMNLKVLNCVMVIQFRKRKFIHLFIQLIIIGSLFFFLATSLIDAENKVVNNIVEVSTLIGLIF